MDNKVIIDGVDVSGCECSSQIDLDINIICNSNSPKKCSGYCKDNPNCYYKQLKRKEQECEKLKKMNEIGLQQWIDMYNKADKERFEALLQRDRYKQALDEMNRKNKGRL